MNAALQQLLVSYGKPSTLGDYEDALREIIQELALLGLWRSKFYEHAAFYEGTALRIFHGLRRFSEGLDFSLLAPNSNFDLLRHLKAVEEELTAFGFSVEVVRHQKKIGTAIESAFIKAGTSVNIFRIGAPEPVLAGLPSSHLLRLKMEVDTDPPPEAQTEVRTLLVPIPFQVRLFELPDLFAGKLHAVLCRNWKRRVKGRDFYDWVWYAGRKIPCRLRHLEVRMRQTGHWDESRPLKEENVREMLNQRIKEVDIDGARRDVLPFLRDLAEVALWSEIFFRDLTAITLFE